MSSENLDSTNPSILVIHNPSESSSSSSFQSSSINLLADSPQQSTDKICQSTLASNLNSTQMASSSHPTRDSSSKDEPEAQNMIPYDQAHYTYILGPLCIESFMFPHITECFILLDSFQLPIAEDWSSIS